MLIFLDFETHPLGRAIERILPLQGEEKLTGRQVIECLWHN